MIREHPDCRAVADAPTTRSDFSQYPQNQIIPSESPDYSSPSQNPIEVKKVQTTE
jgi:hypothetical protein